MIFVDFDGTLFDTSFEAYTVLCNTIPIDLTYEEFMEFRPKVTCLKDYAKLGNIRNIDSFIEGFRRSRRWLRDYTPNYWAMLHNPYEFLNQFRDICRQRELQEVYILSTKDKEFIKPVLDFYTVPFLESHILDSAYIEHYGSKGNVIKQFKTVNNEPHMLIDDTQEHLDSCGENVIMMKATWGYN